MNELPIACSLDSRELAERVAKLEHDLFSRSEDVRHLDNGIAHRFPASDDVKRDLFAFMEAESTCCSFLELDLRFSPGHGPIWLTITGPEHALPFIRDTFSGGT
jgi:hypothetical protein